MNQHELLDRLAMIYMQKSKTSEDKAYALAIEVITSISVKAHQELDRRLKRMRNRGEL